MAPPSTQPADLWTRDRARPSAPAGGPDGDLAEDQLEATGQGWRLAIAVASFASILAVAVAFVVNRNGGTFTYAIDDPAIHLTIARNLGRHGTFGIVPGVYESASSAPLWNLLLAPILAVAPDAWWAPLLLNVAAALWLLRTVARLPFVARLASRRATVAICVAAPVVLGLVPLAMTGMEHTLHAALVAQLLVVLARVGTAGERRRDLVAAVALIAAGTVLRFETGFLALAAAAVIASDGRAWTGGRPRARRVAVAGSLVAAAGVPALTFAAVNRAFGQYALPNSVVAKSRLGQGLPLPDPSVVLERLTQDPVLDALLVAAVVTLVLARSPSRANAAGWTASRDLVVVLVAAALHVCFAEVGWFERYQAYLIVALVVALGLALPALPGWSRSRDRLVMIALVLCILRIPLLVNTPVATANVYANQYQLGRFFEREYQGSAIAVNDLGYVSWFHEGPVLDVAGLGSVEALRATKEGRFDASAFEALAAEHDVRIAAVYPEFFGSLVPPTWGEAGRWCVPGRRMVLSSDCVAFYAPVGDDLDRARAALDRYAPDLPADTTSTTTRP